MSKVFSLRLQIMEATAKKDYGAWREGFQSPTNLRVMRHGEEAFLPPTNPQASRVSPIGISAAKQRVNTIAHYKRLAEP